MWASCLAGIAFGNSGVHVPHGMAYAIAGLVKAEGKYRAPGYPDDHPLVPHGVSVVLSAPSVVRLMAKITPERHLEAAQALGVSVDDVNEAGEALAEGLLELMRSAELPTTLGQVGYTASDVSSLVEVTMMQRRLLENAPRKIERGDLSALFTAAL
jgi:hydroxyacid-oxoacid transhydrogenase